MKCYICITLKGSTVHMYVPTYAIALLNLMSGIWLISMLCITDWLNGHYFYNGTLFIQNPNVFVTTNLPDLQVKYHMHVVKYKRIFYHLHKNQTIMVHNRDRPKFQKTLIECTKRINYIPKILVKILPVTLFSYPKDSCDVKQMLSITFNIFSNL